MVFFFNFKKFTMLERLIEFLSSIPINILFESCQREFLKQIKFQMSWNFGASSRFKTQFRILVNSDPKRITFLGVSHSRGLRYYGFTLFFFQAAIEQLIEQFSVFCIQAIGSNNYELTQSTFKVFEFATPAFIASILSLKNGLFESSRNL